ncbi:hypothetical protein [Nitrosospira lacus]|nr:hypothetical protein [Nitrosospira lacus]
MKLSSISANRSLVLALALGTTLGIGATGVTHAQYGTSGQSGATGQSGSSGQSSSTSSKEGMDTGYVDQKKRVERAADPASPSKDPHVPEFSRDKEGKPIKDPKYEQGGPIGPN